MHRSLVIRNRQRTRSIDLRLLRRIAQTLLDKVLAVERYELGVIVVAAREMTRLNETFLHHKGPTDVITFDYAERDKTELLHGEIFVCLGEAVVQARRFRTRWSSELVRYVIHGVLHLRGFDDRRPAARRKMKREECRLLREMARRFLLRKL